MSSHRQKLGGEGEALAAAYLVGRGYHILERNYRCPLGEIDIIAQERETLTFVEVKTRTPASEGYGPPQLAIHLRKRQQLIRVASYYLAQKRISGRDCRFDIVIVRYLRGQGHPEIALIQDAFTAEEQGRG